TAWTPGIASASATSISTIRACACGLRTVWPQSIPAACRSLAYWNSPVVFGTPSARRTLSPTRPRSSWRGRVVVVASPAGIDRLTFGSLSEPTRHECPARLAVGGGPGCPKRSARRFALISSHPPRREPHRVEDLLVAGAATEVAGQGLANLVLTRVRATLEQRRGRDHQPRRAEPALHGACLDERLLDRVQLAVRAEALDRHDLVAVRLRGEHEARADELPVEQHRARAA